MAQDWTHRPPVLVGERVVWIGGGSSIGGAQQIDFGNYHGTINWIGRLPNLESSWTVGIEFDTEMKDGCNGEWNGRHMFSCQPSHGLFLPVSSIVKESEFYGGKRKSSSNKSSKFSRTPSSASVAAGAKSKSKFDPNLAPEPPPPKMRTTAVLGGPSADSHTRNFLKHGGRDPSSSVSAGQPSSTRGIPSPSSTSSSVPASKPNTSKMDQHTDRKYINPFDAQDTDEQVAGSAVAEVHSPRGSSSQGNRQQMDVTPPSRSILRSNSQRNEYSDINNYYGGAVINRDMIDKDVSNASILPQHSRTPSFSTPSSPNLSEYQRSYHKKTSTGSNSTTVSDWSQMMCSPERYSLIEKPYNTRRERSSGILNIFKWFRKRGKKSQSLSIDRDSNMSETGSQISDSSSMAYHPITRSKSAENANKMKKKSHFGLTRRYRIFGSNPSTASSQISSSSQNELNRRLSICSGSSTATNTSTLGRKKRPAPHPPSSPDLNCPVNKVSTKSISSKDLTHINRNDRNINEIPDGRRLQKSTSEGFIYSRNKRRAPQPPVQISDISQNISTTSLSREGSQKKRKAPEVPAKKNRPISALSNTSSPWSLSTNSTLRSQDSSSSGVFTSESLKVGSGQSISQSSSSQQDLSKPTLSPKPWYKRKKNREKKESKENYQDDSTYESWMPSRNNLAKDKDSNKMESPIMNRKEDDKKDKRKSQVSMLASISELDRAANEQFKKGQEQKKVEKEKHDSKFFKVQGPHILTQQDFSKKIDPKIENIPSSQGENNNASTLGGDSNIVESYSRNTTLRIEKNNNPFSSDNSPSAPDASLLNMGREESNSSNLDSFVPNRITINPNHSNIFPSSSNTNKSTCQPQPIKNAEENKSDSRASPIQKAVFDAELFYKLAKDSQNLADNKSKKSPVVNRATRDYLAREANKNRGSRDSSESEEECDDSRIDIGQARRGKNFGVRMNNIFSPDVSTITEASESMSSCANTPLDDLYADMPFPSTNCTSGGDMSHQEYNESIHDFRLNSCDAREIMQELADVRREIALINAEEDEETKKRDEKKKADLIREEVLLLRERNNFHVWQEMMDQRAASESMNLMPVDTGAEEKKRKWVCDACTLINLPWRLQCEACMSRRPVNPKRVDGDGNVSPSVSNASPVTVINLDTTVDGNITPDVNGAEADLPEVDNQKSGSNKANDSQINDTVVKEQEKKKKNVNWENELQKYFTSFDDHVKSIGETTSALCNSVSNSNSHGDGGIYGKIKRLSKDLVSAAERKKDKEVNKEDKFVALSEITQQEGTGNDISGISNSNQNEKAEPDVQMVRNVRLAKFSIEEKISKMQGAESPKLVRKERKSKSNHDSNGTPKIFRRMKHLEAESNKMKISKTNHSTDVNNDMLPLKQSEENFVQFRKEEGRTFYKKDYRKPQVMKNVGAVKTAVTVFNDLEEVKKPMKTKGSSRPRRKKSVGIIDQTNIFEQIATESNGQDRSQGRENYRPSIYCSVLKDKEIVAAIKKFDEMAAMAEVDRLETQRLREKLRSKPGKLCVVKKPQQSEVKSLEFDGVVKDGVLYTGQEPRSRSMSIGSGTFELFQARDLESIVAQHIEVSSKCGASENQNLELSPMETTMPTVTPAVAPVSPKITVESSTNDLTITPSTTTITTIVTHSPQQNPGCDILNKAELGTTNNKSNDDKKDVEELSKQLTGAQGIASFKETLKVDEPNIGQMNTLRINKILKKLEDAISKGNHADAAAIAKELAQMRLDCRVIKNTKRVMNGCGEHTPQETSTSSTTDKMINTKPFGLPTGIVGQEDSSRTSKKMSENIEANSSTPNQQTEKVSKQDNADSRKLVSKPQPSENIQVLSQISPTQKDSITKGSPSNLREIGIDPARREVKSDPITLLGDGFPALMKEDAEQTPFDINLYIEDKNSHQGPITLSVTSNLTLEDLREKVRDDFGFPSNVQRWIIGRRLIDDDSQTLEALKLSEGCPIFLYLVVPETEPMISLSSYSLLQNKGKYGLVSTEKKSATDKQVNSAVKYDADNDYAEDDYANDDDYDDNDTINGDEDDYEDAEDYEDAYYEDDYEDEDDDDDAYTYDDFHSVVSENSRLYEKLNIKPIPNIEITLTPASEDGNENIIYKDHTTNPNSDENYDKVYSTTYNTATTSVAQNFGHIKSKQEPTIPAINAIYQQVDQIDRSEVSDKSESKNILTSVSSNDKTSKHSLSENKVQTQELKDNQIENTVTSEPLVKSKENTGTIESESDNSYEIGNIVGNVTVISAPTPPTRTLASSIMVQATTQQQQSKLKALATSSKSQRSTGIKDQPVKPSQETSTSKFFGQFEVRKISVNDQIATDKDNQIRQEELSRNELVNENEKEITQKDEKNYEATKISKQISPDPLLLKKNTKSTRVTKKDLIKPDILDAKEDEPKQTLESTNQTEQSKQENLKLPDDELPEQLTGRPVSPAIDGWVCPTCTLVNRSERPGCEACATDRPLNLQNEEDQGAEAGGLGEAMKALDSQGVVANQETFECSICFLDVEIGEGCVLRDCLHMFCRECLCGAIKHSDSADVKCPYRDDQYSCEATLQERELKDLVPAQEYEAHLRKSVKQAEGSMQNVFHCKTPDCPGFCQFEDNVDVFNCEVCKKSNCLTCQAQHKNQTCQEYQNEITGKVDEAALKTKKFFDDMIKRGDGIPCPSCSVMLVRKWGCDWMKCPMCKTEICWVTKGPRWGPGGTGDTSGGCQCGVRGRKCHPKCTYCH